MSMRSKTIPRWLVSAVLGVVVFITFAQPGLSQFNIGIGGGSDDDGINIDIFRAAKTVRSASEAKQGFTYAQEHYLGRAIAANILSEYKLYEDPAANRYVTLLGQAIAMHSDMPQTYGGYRFLILDSDEVNALAAPGGIIFITRGMLRACENEDQLAAVLAHEVAHVQGRHGVELINDSRWKKFGTDAVFLAASGFGGGDIAAATELFGDMVKDITNEILTKGYGKKLESEADTASLSILQRVGYEPHESVALMQNMEERFERGRKDFGSTHPKPKDRIKTIDKALKHGPDAQAVPPVRESRFDTALSAAKSQ
jgi:predicted Zn-dependent protease